MRFEGIAVIEGEDTGDGRLIGLKAVRWEEGPWPLRFERTGTHDGIVVGTITDTWRSGTEVRVAGTLHADTKDPETFAAVQRVVELAEEGLAGLSVRLDSEEVEMRVKLSVLNRSTGAEESDYLTGDPELFTVNRSGWSSMPINKEARWDGAAARRALASWSGVDKSDAPRSAWNKYRRAFLWYDSGEPGQVGSYKFPLAFPAGGRLSLNLSAVNNAKARLAGASIPDADKARMELILNAIQRRAGVGEEATVVVGEWTTGDEQKVITAGRMREVSVVDQPAIVGTKLRVITDPVAASGGVDSAFTNPRFGPDGDQDVRLVWQEPIRNDEVGHWGCPLTLTNDGHLFGHLATKGRCHGSFPDICLNLDGLDPSYTFDEFLTGQAVPGIRTGPIVLNTSHSIRADGSVKDWDWLADTGDAVADVAVGQDHHGIWVSGRVRPGIGKQQLAALKGSALSGEWVPSPGKLGLRLAGILAVNSPGFLVRREPVAASGGRVLTLGPDCGCHGTELSALARALQKVGA